jgi:parallel beta-helix repeat protein
MGTELTLPLGEAPDRAPLVGRVAAAIVLTLVVLTANPPRLGAQGSTLYVDQGNPGCSDSGPGDLGSPFCTIARGAAVAVAGQTVLVSSGRYVGLVSVAHSGAPGSPIVFAAAPGATVIVTGGTYGFRIPGRSWITVEGFAITGTVKHGIYASSGAHIALIGNEVSFAGEPVKSRIGRGIVLSAVTDSLVDGNRTDHNTDHGIYLSGGTARTTVRYNESFANARQFARAAAGIHVAGSHDNVILGNRAHGNEDTGIQMRTGSADNLVAGNVSWHNGDHGFDTLGATGTRYVADTAFGNHKDGFSIEGTSTGTTLANCVAVDNGLSTNEYDLYVAPSSVGGFSADYDLIWNSSSKVPIKFNGVRYASLAAFTKATGYDVHGIGADPQFVDPGSGNLRLQPGSPAIDSANSGASGQPEVDADGNPRVDDPNTPNTGAGPRPYDDRGAYEYQPG